MLKKIVESIIEFVEALLKGNQVALVVLLGLLLFTICLRIKVNRPIELPIQAHNTIGNLPLVETFDDGGTNKKDQGVESRPKNKVSLVSTDISLTNSISQDIFTFR